MQEDDSALPAYDRPPVVEVALAVQFEDDIGYRLIDLAEIARVWSDALPKVEERHPLPPMTLHPEGPNVALKLSEEIDTPLLWLQNEQGDQLLQLQQDRLTVNWRRLPPNTPYPRYASIRQFFGDTWKQLTGLLKHMELAAPEPSICEVLYLNQLDAHNGWQSVEDMSTLIAPWAGSVSDDFLPKADQAGFFTRFELPDERGWLVIDSRPGQLRDNVEVQFLRLVSRGIADPPNLEGILDFMDLAHEWIVRGFTSITTAKAHTIWGRTT